MEVGSYNGFILVVQEILAKRYKRTSSRFGFFHNSQIRGNYDILDDTRKITTDAIWNGKTQPRTFRSVI
jgi:hypothetical protein